MSSGLLTKLDRAARLIDDILDNEGPLPMDVQNLLHHAYDDLEQSRGKERVNSPPPKIYLGKFEPGDKIAFSVFSSSLPLRDVQTVPVILPALVLKAPKKRSPNDYEDMGGKLWFFTSDLPVSTTIQIDCVMHVETKTDFREVFHLRGEHWSRWREKNSEYWSILSLIPEDSGGDAMPL